ncbi:unnamed protein product [Cuscuta campestris]|uniref:Retroviral polymerase SH3-like domain-containing protein n=1 Tax=Cuscuta campestris TaxID=132261 RepID=A0A484LZ95_9ASTE|nr:unnamed protein product [Cuscuta campestris]
MVRSMISLTTLPESFWGYALKTAAHTLNRVPSKVVKSTPYELWRGRKPSFSYFKIWGCEAYVKHLMTSSKLEPKSDKVIFVGYPKETRGYEFYHPSDNKILVARNGTFLEKEFLSAITSGRKVDLEEIREPQEEVPIVLEHEQRDQAIEPQTAQDIPRRSDRIRNPPVRYGFLMSDEGDVLLVDQGEPETYLEAITCPESDLWLEAMKSEMESMYTNQVWTLVDAPEGVNPIGCKWVFKKKTDVDGKAAKEAVWIKKFITELGVVPSINDPISLFCDNTGAIAQAKEPRSHQKTKHIVRRYHIIREIVDRGDVMICKVDTCDNIADPLTKPLGKLKHEGHTRSMGIRLMPDWP